MKLSALLNMQIDGPDPDITGLTADSRDVKAGFLFAALSGTQADGAAYIPQAEAAGAAAVLAGPDAEASVPIVNVQNPRLVLAKASAAFYETQPEIAVAVTGTNGKTSVARFVAQLWRGLGLNGGSLGTIGAEADGYFRKQRHTTPDPVEFHDILAEMAGAGVSRVALEASSHGLAQHRVDGVRLNAAGFTNISQDHLDYHDTFEDYFAAKARLFTEVLPGDGVAVVDVDTDKGRRMAALARDAARRTMTVGQKGEDISYSDVKPTLNGLDLKLCLGGKAKPISLPLIGGFQAANAVLAAGLVMACGDEAEAVLPLLENLKGVPGRLQKAGQTKAGAVVYVDYAHTPDAITTVLAAVRPHTEGRVSIVFGAGGDRDVTKRPLMGRAAAAGAETVIVTDDNPRSEAPEAIRAAVKEGAPDAADIGDRREAIAAAIKGAGKGDVVVIAGKGHETGQTVGTETLPFDDVAVARAEILDLGGTI